MRIECLGRQAGGVQRPARQRQHHQRVLKNIGIELVRTGCVEAGDGWPEGQVAPPQRDALREETVIGKQRRVVLFR
ncbi:hypothetical protein [Aggregatilinea lenta]|uniref:hypothetical protein n=1 Tax=Aggregatilinea lenta TaxID=913108 RepID=UPI0013C36B99|nr:hypothetical protein [Aggregatilinea lenta]